MNEISLWELATSGDTPGMDSGFSFLWNRLVKSENPEMPGGHPRAALRVLRPHPQVPSALHGGLLCLHLPANVLVL